MDIEAEWFQILQENASVERQAMPIEKELKKKKKLKKYKKNEKNT
jgi:hypothetical protein